MSLSTKAYLVDQGASWGDTFVLTDQSGNLVPLTGASAQFMVRLNATDTVTPLLSLTSPSGGITLQSPGNIIVNATPTQTSAITPGVYTYELEVTYAGGSRDSLAKGAWVLSPSVVH